MIPMYEYFGQQYVDKAREKLGTKVDQGKSWVGKKVDAAGQWAGDFLPNNANGIAQAMVNPYLRNAASTAGKYGSAIAGAAGNIAKPVGKYVSNYITKHSKEAPGVLAKAPGMIAKAGKYIGKVMNKAV